MENPTFRHKKPRSVQMCCITLFTQLQVKKTLDPGTKMPENTILYSNVHTDWHLNHIYEIIMIIFNALIRINILKQSFLS